MDLKKLENIFKREFRKIKGLYCSFDEFLVVDRGHGIDYKYRSFRHSCENGDDDYYENSTKIIFSEVEYEKSLRYAVINLLCVHLDIRDEGYGGQMVRAVEEIFRLRGLREVEVEQIDNFEFWKKMGYEQNIRVRGCEESIVFSRFIF